MSDEGQPLSPEQVFKKFAWRSVVAVAPGLERSTTWTITGVAAIVALFVGNLEAVSKIVNLGGIRWSLLLLAASLLLGAISKQIGMALESGLASVTEVEKLLTSKEGDELMEAMSVEPRKLMHDLAEPFVWPLSLITRRSGEQGVVDYLSSDKRFIRMFCWQIYFNLFHAITAVAAIVVLACSMKIA
jgi:hypothetical protein